MSDDLDPTVYLNGEWGPLSEARIPVLDRGFIFGDGMYEVVPLYASRTAARLPARAASGAAARAASARSASTIPFDDAGWRALIARAIENESRRGRRARLYPGDARRRETARPRVSGRHRRRPVFMMINAAHASRAPRAASKARAPVTAEDKRWLHCDIKSRVAARQRADGAACRRKRCARRPSSCVTDC